MAQSLVLSIDVCRGLGISPLRVNISLSYSQADLGPRSAQELFSGGGLKKFELFFRRFVLIASGTEIFWRVRIFEILTFDGNIAFPLSPVSTITNGVDIGICRILCLNQRANIHCPDPVPCKC